MRKVTVGPGKYAADKNLRSLDVRGPKWEEISTFLNSQFGFSFVQHGAQFHFQPGAFEAVNAFGAAGEREFWSAAQVQARYQQWNRLA